MGTFFGPPYQSSGIKFALGTALTCLLKEIWRYWRWQWSCSKWTNERNKVIFKNSAPFRERITRINNTQINNTKEIDVVMLMYNLIEYSDNYSKTWKFLAITPIFFIYQGFLSRLLMTHKIAKEGMGPSFIPLYHFHPLMNIQTFICNFVCEMNITYF